MSVHADRAGRTRWRRFAGLFGVSAVVSAGLVVLMAEGALAANFKVSGQQFKVSADTLDGTGFVQYGWVDAHIDNKAEPVAVSGIKSAQLTNMCQSVLTTLPIVGDISLKLSAGTGDKKVEATNLMIDMTQLEGNAEFTNIEIGRDASTLNKGPAGAVGFGQLFGQQSDTVHIENLRQVAWASTAAKFTLPDLKLKVTKGKDECF